MSKGKSKTTGRTGSNSNNGSRASASDRRHDREQVMENKSQKIGTPQRGRLKNWQGGPKRP